MFKYEELLLSHVEEFEFLESKIKEDPENVIYRRLIIKSIFSSLEIITNGLIEYVKPLIMPKLLSKIDLNKQYHHPNSIHNHSDDYKILFTICAVDDKSYKIDDSGKIIIERPKIPLKNRLLFTMQLLFETTNKTVNPKTIDGWSEVFKATKIRDRLTHPQVITDLYVSKEDYETVLEMKRWVLRCIYYGRED